MALTAAPKITVPWANTGVNRTSIPTASQISVTPGAASWTDGFPPLCMTPIASGGIPPAGPDFNGVLYSLSQSLQWLQAGSGYQFDGSFATAVGGYPLYAQVQRSDGQGLWINTIANNTADPEGSPTSGWLPLSNNATTAITMTSSNVTLTALQAGAGIIYLSGLLTANLNLVFPTWNKEWLVVNNCTGAFSVTCKTASGSGVAISTGNSTIIYGDGTNVVVPGQIQSNMQVFTSSGSFPTPSGVQKVKFRALGPGGGGGGSTVASSSCGGAASGSYCEGVINVSASGTLTITIGAGGAQGTTGNGSVGGNTSISGTGVSIVVPGGGASGGMSISGVGASGIPGAIPTISGANVVASLATQGSPGQIGVYGPGAGYFGGNGGSSPFGGPLPGNGGFPGAAAGAYGSGGSGGANNNYGGNGAPGVVILEW